MTRRTAALWLVGLAAVLLNLHFSCPASHGQEVARVPSSGVVVVERIAGTGTVRITIPTATGRIVVEVDAGAGGGDILPPVGPELPPPGGGPDASAERKLRGMLEQLPGESRLKVARAYRIAINKAVDDLLPNHTDADLIPWMVEWGNAYEPGHAEAVSAVALLLPDLPGEALRDRLEALRAIVEEYANR